MARKVQHLSPEVIMKATIDVATLVAIGAFFMLPLALLVVLFAAG
jgi:hypothetical protein